MNSEQTSPTPSRGWSALRRWTPARVGLDRAGGSLPTSAHLEFRLAHSRARDALTRPLDENKLAQDLEKIVGAPVLRLHSAANSLDEFLARPDLGRQLSSESVEILQPLAVTPTDLALIVSEGLSTLAVETHAAAVLNELWPLLGRDGWQLAPVSLVRFGRVAVQDQIGELLGARAALILLGERPGLVSPDSLGAYLVHQPRRGRTDAERNCVSNINARGLSAAPAAAKLHWLLTESRRRQISGVKLKDEFDSERRVGKGPSLDVGNHP